MSHINKSIELTLSEYLQRVGLNPDNLRYQRIPAESVSLNRATWRIKNSVNKRALLLSLGWIDWKPTITKFRADNITAENFVNNGIWASYKPIMPFMNATEKIELRINGGQTFLHEPRHFQDHLNMLYVGKEGSKKAFSHCSTFPRLNGFHTNDPINFGNIGAEAPIVLRVDNDNITIDANAINVGPTGAGVNNGLFWEDALEIFSQGLEGGYKIIDHDHLQNEMRFRELLGRAAGVNDLNATNNHQINCLEPLIIPPFNPYFCVRDELPEYSWFKNMSPMIPHVNNLTIDIFFKKLSASTLFPRYLRSTGNNEIKTLGISSLAADLILYWYIPPQSFVLPQQITLQSWNVIQNSIPLNDGNVINNDATINNVSIRTQLHTIPTLIIIHAEVDKDSISYTNTSVTADTDQTGTESQTSLNANALDSYMEISNFNVRVGDRPNILPFSFTQEELYNLTLKNSKGSDFAYPFDKWRGAHQLSPNKAGEAFNQMSKCFIALRPKDIAEKLDDGFKLFAELEFNMSLTARDGFHNIAGGNKIYKLYIHNYYGKHKLTLTEKTGFYEQDIMDSHEIAHTLLERRLLE